MIKKGFGFKSVYLALLAILIVGFLSCGVSTKEEGEKDAIIQETEEERDQRMAWWREARFGMFIHWGLYAIPAGEWEGETRHAEWILTTAQIPVKEYEKFAPQFNPVKFNAREWVRMAKEAGMRYIVITSKHHDGFCLFDSKLTDYDIMDATPFKRDIMKELADECREQGLKICWYHSIMDWHHPDYLPRRNWEMRSAEGANYDRFVEYMKGQVKELVTNYGEIGVLWFDGEWEYTWDSERGRDLYQYVRSLQPNIIINNRVGKGRAGMTGTYDPETASGDFGTPEQEIPATGLSYDWETCMTMNDHWGYNKHDQNWKSKEDLIRKLVDIASKGGNFLLNVGPTSEGLFPEPSIERLKAMGEWMKINGESIYGTTASLFSKLDWGRSTTKKNKLFLHVFDWPDGGKLEVPGLVSQAESVYPLADPQSRLNLTYKNGSAILSLPGETPDPIVSVIVMEFKEEPEVVRDPEIKAENDIFCDDLEVSLSSNLERVKIRYTLDYSQPTNDSPVYRKPIKLDRTTTVKCQVFRDGQAISAVVGKTFRKVVPRAADATVKLAPGLHFEYFHGTWDNLPDFDELAPVSSGEVESFDISRRDRKEHFGFRFTGYITVPRDGVYKFYVASDDGSRLFIGRDLVVDNDGLHGSVEVMGRIALEKGSHPITVGFFQKTGGVDFEVSYSGPRIEKQTIPASSLFHARQKKS
ncbi:MAG: alpha-L-fucosidase [Candidatus Aminicenantes bacterium]|nr:MAG: alpha-L-fucosidase [Candidatus Aminicenantes bacterium]